MAGYARTTKEFEMPFGFTIHSGAYVRTELQIAES